MPLKIPTCLTESDWKGFQSKNKAVKADLAGPLRNLKAANTKDDFDEMIESLEAVAERAEEEKQKFKADKTVSAHLADIIRSGNGLIGQVMTASEKAAEGDGEGAIGPILGRLLPRVKRLDAERAWNFVAALGTPICGLMVSKKAIGPNHVKLAKAARKGKGGVIKGRCYGQGPKLVFDLGEVKPPGGLARILRKSINEHTKATKNKLNVGVILRGGGENLDDEADGAELADGVVLPDQAEFLRLVDEYTPLREQLKGMPNRDATEIDEGRRLADQWADQGDFENAAQTMDSLVGAVRQLLIPDAP
jgi:hypothetical protein